jgi:hypothetical protein
MGEIPNGRLIADEAQLSTFVNALFRYADEGTYASLRQFPNKGSDKSKINGIKLNGDGLKGLIKAAAHRATEAANNPEGWVFAPPVATFSDHFKASAEHLANGLAVSVECDENPEQARKFLESLIGPATIVVASGGQWTDPETGEIQAKLHLHWRLTEPTRTQEDHKRLYRARVLASRLVGGDPTSKPVVHPLRWPGSYHTKTGTAVLCSLIKTTDAEIELGFALELLEGAAGAARLERDDEPHETNQRGATASLEELQAAIAVLPNLNAHWDDWNKIGMALWRSAGSAGLQLFDDFSRKSAKYDPQETLDRWNHYSDSPPLRLTAGTIFYHASRADPLWRDRFRQSKQQKPNGHDHEYTGRQQPTNEPGEQQKPGTINRFKPVFVEDIQVKLDRKDFVDNLLGYSAFSIVYGESNCGKTFCATDLSLAVSLGKVWGGRQCQVGGVVYCALEGGNSVHNRIAAYKIHYGLETDIFPFALIPSQINLLDEAADVQDLIATVKQCAEKFECPVHLIVIDTLSRAMAGGNENAPDDMGALVFNADALRQATGAHVMFIHHSGKNQALGARGHSLLRAATDTELEVTKDEYTKVSRLSVTKQRDMDQTDDICFKLNVIELGRDDRDKAVTSCVLEFIDASTQQPRGAVLSASNRRALELLRQAVESGGGVVPVSNQVSPNTYGCTVSLWREYCYNGSIAASDDPNSRRKAFHRASTALQDSGHIRVWGDYVWTVERGNS